MSQKEQHNRIKFGGAKGAFITKPAGEKMAVRRIRFPRSGIGWECQGTRTCPRRLVEVHAAGVEQETDRREPRVAQRIGNTPRARTKHEVSYRCSTLSTSSFKALSLPLILKCALAHSVWAHQMSLGVLVLNFAQGSPGARGRCIHAGTLQPACASPARRKGRARASCKRSLGNAGTTKRVSPRSLCARVTQLQKALDEKDPQICARCFCIPVPGHAWPVHQSFRRACQEA